MGVTEDVLNVVQAPGMKVVVAVTRKRRVQLEYTIQSKLKNVYVNRVRNGTEYRLGNKSTIVLQISGSEGINIDTTKWKAKEWKEWITDAKPEEKKDVKA